MGLFRWLFGQACKLVFKKVDHNGDGKLDLLEVEVAILYLYNVFNKRLPGWQDPPNRDAIKAALATFDTNQDGVLDQKEFEEFARNFLKDGPDQFFSRLGRNALTQTAVLPVASLAVREVAKNTPLGKAPLSVLAPAIGVLFNAIKGILPIKL